jgi:DNA-binding transcriptional MocR family regulator
VLNPGDPVLLEAPLYAGVLPYLQVINAEMVGTSDATRIAL